MRVSCSRERKRRFLWWLQNRCFLWQNLWLQKPIIVENTLAFQALVMIQDFTKPSTRSGKLSWRACSQQQDKWQQSVRGGFESSRKQRKDGGEMDWDCCQQPKNLLFPRFSGSMEMDWIGRKKKRKAGRKTKGVWSRWTLCILLAFKLVREWALISCSVLCLCMALLHHLLCQLFLNELGKGEKKN